MRRRGLIRSKYLIASLLVGAGLLLSGQADAQKGKLCVILCGAQNTALDFQFQNGLGSQTAATFTVPGTGQAITFSQTTLSTLFDATGKLTYAPNNLLAQSNTFSNAAWGVKTTVTITSGVADPFGGTNAWTITATGANSRLAQSSSVTIVPFVNQLVTVWARRRTGTGTVNFEDVGVGVGPAISLTGSWQQFTYTASKNASNPVAGIRISVSGDAVDLYAFTSSNVTYETSPRPQDQVITGASAYFGPRFDYNPATLALNGLRDEPATTALELQSRDLSTASWTKSNVTAAHTATGIDGVANSASSLTATAGNGTVLQSVTQASSAETLAPFVKRVTGTGEIDITLDGGSTWTNITSLINSSTYTQVSAEQTVTNPSIGFRIVTNGDAIAVDMAQLEGLAYYTSSVPTAAAQVTRAAEIISATVPSSITNGKVVSGAVKAMTGSGIGANIQIAQQIDSGSAANRVRTYRDTNGHVKVLFTSGSADQATLDLGAVGNLTVFTVAWRANNGSFGASLNGAAEVTGSGTQPAGLTTIRGNDASNANQLAGWQQKWALWAANINTPQKATGAGW